MFQHSYKPDRNRRRPWLHRPHRYRPRQVFIEEDARIELAAQLAVENEFWNLDDEDADSLFGMVFTLMHLGISESSDEEN